MVLVGFRVLVLHDAADCLMKNFYYTCLPPPSSSHIDLLLPGPLPGLLKVVCFAVQSFFGVFSDCVSFFFVQKNHTKKKTEERGKLKRNKPSDVVTMIPPLENRNRSTKTNIIVLRERELFLL